MRIIPLTTGRVRLKDAFLNARTGPTRQPRLLLPGPFHGPMPIHAWVVEDAGRRILVDTGERRSVRDLPFCRFEVDAELPDALAAAGLELGAIDACVLTHLHGDHMNGAIHLGIPVGVHDAELAFARTPMARLLARAFRQPLPQGVDFRPLALDGGPFGAFAAHRRLTDRVLLVSTPGHTPGHASVLCLEDDHHVLLAGDAADTLEQLRARRPDAVAPKPAVHVETLDRILAHARSHPTVFLPSHDPESVARLAARATV